MKRLLVTMLTSAAMCAARAQLFSPEALSGAMWGSLVGGVAGGDCRHGFSGKGAGIGAGVGLVAGALASEARHRSSPAGESVAFVAAPAISFGYGYGSCGSSGYVYCAPDSYCAPGYYYRPTRANYAVSGTVLGAASGALIGAGNERAGPGAAIGAAAGLVLGSAAELAARRHQPEVVATPAPTQPATASLPTQDAGQITSQPCATSTYTWTPHPQIADAPRVPDAPTF
jgi:hypothetical protein